MSTKSDLRQILLAHRREVSSMTRQKAAEKAAELFLNLPLFQQSTHIACYYPYNNEFDSLPIIQKIWNEKKNCYLPVVSSDSTLDFVLYEKNTELEKNQHYILQPVNHNKIAIDKLNLVVLPLLGFDLRGNRLGMGKGYYDRTFAAVKNSKTCFLLGLAYAFQAVESLPSDSWDVKLNGVLTEKNMIFF
ncbi:MAG TPA: 5-formyltetrahydrofolate cyclo-ligase [Gammaproteobacteria bacterium]|nr:5-formyltetrahydrofolate cyclo-ligase [Gammaproteobacteria bacterium]